MSSSAPAALIRSKRPSAWLTPLARFNLGFFLFGLLNNAPYVVILSAALDLVDKQSTPKGLILLVNIAPALLVKIGWPYFVHGEVRYARRVVGCTAVAWGGILVVALSHSLGYRLSGIALASFASGLGEMTYLQLATTFSGLSSSSSSSRDLSGEGVGWFASGTGGAGIVGAGLWWVLRGLGVRTGLGITTLLPLGMSTTYFGILPGPEKFSAARRKGGVWGDEAYEPLRPSEEGIEEEDDDEDQTTAEEEEGRSSHQHQRTQSKGVRPDLSPDVTLSTSDKLALARPLVRRFMLPLFFVYLAEYTINQGVAPTLLFKVPERGTVLGAIIKKLKDYYPLWQLVYQTFVFLSRSSITVFRLPPLPSSLIPLPTFVQLGLLALTTFESLTGFLEGSFLGEGGATWITGLLIAAEGISGGLSYVNVFHRLGVESPSPELELDATGGGTKSAARLAAEKEFRIASVGFADTAGILAASLVASALEPRLCKVQVGRGRNLCREVGE